MNAPSERTPLFFRLPEEDDRIQSGIVGSLMESFQEKGEFDDITLEHLQACAQGFALYAKNKRNHELIVEEMKEAISVMKLQDIVDACTNENPQQRKDAILQEFISVCQRGNYRKEELVKMFPDQEPFIDEHVWQAGPTQSASHFAALPAIEAASPYRETTTLSEYIQHLIDGAFENVHQLGVRPAYYLKVSVVFSGIFTLACILYRISMDGGNTR